MLAVMFFTKLPTPLKIQVVHPIVKALEESINSKVQWKFCFYDPGNSPNVASNPECTGRYRFFQFRASAICFTNPLTTGRYVGIMTTESQVLQLCEVEVYSRGNSTYW